MQIISKSDYSNYVEWIFCDDLRSWGWCKTYRISNGSYIRRN